MRRFAALLPFLLATQILASSNDAAWRLDIQYLTTELPKRHKNAFFHTTKEAFESASAALIADVPSLDDAAVVVGLYQLVATIGDAHTSAYGWSFASYPFDVWWFDEGLYVTRATAAQSDLLGCRITAVNGHPTDEVTAAVGTVFAHENEMWLRARVPAYFVLPDVLRALGFGGDTFTFERPDGTMFDRTLQQAAAGETWVEPPVPRSRRNAQLNYWAEYIGPLHAIYLKYNVCQNARSQPFAAFLNDLGASVANVPVERLVVDLRDNGGGDSSVLQPLITAIQATPSINRADALFVLIGRKTFSSAMLNAIQLDQQTNATLVGEPTGGKPNAYGEVQTLQLPYFGIVVQYSTTYFTVLPGQDLPSVEPEIAVRTTPEAYFEGRDPVAEAVLPLFVRRRPAGR